MNIKDKIIEKLKNDKDLLFGTLRNELIGNSSFDYMIVFESIDEGGIQFLEEQYSDFATIFEESKKIKCYLKMMNILLVIILHSIQQQKKLNFMMI